MRRIPCGVRRAGIVIDLFFDHGAVQIVGAEAQSDLRNLGSHHLPVRLDVREIVQQQAAHGDLSDIRQARGLRQMLQRRVVRVKGQRDEGLEATSFVLQRRAASAGDLRDLRHSPHVRRAWSHWT